MPNTFAPEVAGLGTVPTTQAYGGVQGGRLRRYRATVPFAAQASGDTITLAVIPAGHTFAFGVVNATATFGASATVAIGTAASAGKYRAAAVHTAVVPTMFGVPAAADDAPLSAAETVIMTVGVAALPGSGSAVVDLYFSAP